MEGLPTARTVREHWRRGKRVAGPQINIFNKWNTPALINFLFKINKFKISAVAE